MDTYFFPASPPPSRGKAVGAHELLCTMSSRPLVAEAVFCVAANSMEMDESAEIAWGDVGVAVMVSYPVVLANRLVNSDTMERQ